MGVKTSQGPQKELGQGRSDIGCWAEPRALQRRGVVGRLYWPQASSPVDFLNETIHVLNV